MTTTRGRRLAVLLVGVALTGCSARAEPAAVAPSSGLAAPDPATGARIDGVTVLPEPSKQHVAGRLTYSVRPPAGGDHWPPSAGGVTGWLTCGTYAEPVPDEFAVHSLEHGAVWLTHRPDADAAALAGLAALRPDHVLVTPYAGQAAPYTATAWGLQLTTDRADDPRLEQFVRAYAGGGQGGEPGAPCLGGSTPEQARAALDAAR